MGPYATMHASLVYMAAWGQDSTCVQFQAAFAKPSYHFQAYYGEEQGLYLFDNDVNDFLYGSVLRR